MVRRIDHDVYEQRPGSRRYGLLDGGEIVDVVHGNSVTAHGHSYLSKIRPRVGRMRGIHATCGELDVFCAVGAVVEERHDQVHLVPDRGVEVRQPTEHETAITARQ